MDIKVTTNFDSYTKQWLAQLEQLIIKCLITLGELCNSKARQDGTYNDISGDLRSSIGYGVIANGKIVKIGGFKQVKQGSQGVADGISLVKELASNYPKGYALIVVAGAKHAEKVEALDGKVVLTSAELYAQQNASQILQQIAR